MSGKQKQTKRGFFYFLKRFFLFLKRIFTYNISTMLFGAILFYMLITVFMYATSDHIASYQVTQGPLTKNPVCTGLALRSEELVQTQQEGYVDYYAREGMQVRKNGLVYAIDSQKSAENNSAVQLSKEELEEVRSDMAKFANSYDENNFLDTYSFKYELQGNILQGFGASNYINAQEAADSSVQTSESASQEDVLKGYPAGLSMPLGDQDVYTAPTAGLVVYSKDGYEEKTPETLTTEDFDQKSYKQVNLFTTDSVSSGEDIYKLITSENWSLMIPLTDQLAATLAGKESITVKFLKDGETQNGEISIVTIDDQKTARIDLRNGMSRYASDRFLEVELLINTQSGLKIPVSSIVTKEFYVIPRGFLTQGDNSYSRGFLREVQGKGGDLSTEFVSASIYREEDASGKEVTSETAASEGICFVEKGTLQKGDILKMPDSGETFVVGEYDYLEGVYCINLGYAQFRQIEILDQNEEYCIVSNSTPYGLASFDSIVLNGESVHEEEILY